MVNRARFTAGIQGTHRHQSTAMPCSKFCTVPNTKFLISNPNTAIIVIREYFNVASNPLLATIHHKHSHKLGQDLTLVII